MQDTDSITPLPIFQLLKSRLFLSFYRINSLQLPISPCLSLCLILIETLQLLSLVLNDGSYSQLGPYGSTNPWANTDTSWLIDICWSVRIDRYFRTSQEHFALFISLCSFLCIVVVTLGVVLAVLNHTSTLTNIISKLTKLLIMLLTNPMFIPIGDSLVMGVRCAVAPTAGCVSEEYGYLEVMGFIGGLGVFVSLTMVCSVLCGDFCMVSGGYTAKPHPRFKLLRLCSHLTLILLYYFLDITWKTFIFLTISLFIGLLFCYIHIHYLPYYHLTLCKFRLSQYLLFTSTISVLLIGQFTLATGQNSTQIVYILYFLALPILHIGHLMVNRSAQNTAKMKLAQLNSPLSVEIKARVLLKTLEKAELGNEEMAMMSEENSDASLERVKNTVLEDVEKLYFESFRKFPKSEYLYLWSSSLQLFTLKQPILALVQCFKGLAVSNRIDSQCALYAFRHIVEKHYKNYLQNDAFEFVIYEKSCILAQKHDFLTTKTQFLFWNELFNFPINWEKLMDLTGNLSSLIEKTRNCYEKLVALNANNRSGYRLYGLFLQSISGYSDLSLRYLAKSEVQFESRDNYPLFSNENLSFFDTDCGLVSVSGDFETIGEIRKVNTQASLILGYLQNEALGRNIALVIPEPFGSRHDEYMKKFHENGRYSTLNTLSLTLYYHTKPGHLVVAKTLIQVIPSDSEPPYFLSAFKPLPAPSLIALISPDFLITDSSQAFKDITGLSEPVRNDIHLSEVLPELKQEQVDIMGKWKEVEIRSRRGKIMAKIDLVFIGNSEVLVLEMETIGEDVVESIPVASNYEEEVVSSESESEESSDSDSNDEEVSVSIPNPRTISFKDDIPSSHNPLSGTSLLQIPQISGKLIDSQDANSYSSRGSSMVSTPQFSKSVKELIEYEQGKIHWKKWVFHIGIVVLMIVVLGMALAIVQIGRMSIDMCKELSHDVVLVGKQRLNTHSLSYYTRLISLIHSNHIQPGNQTMYTTWLSLDSSELHSTNFALFQHFSRLNYASKEIYINPNVRVWVKTGKRYGEMKIGLLDAVGSLAEQAFLLLGESGKYSFEDRKVYYIYRNGIGETLQAVNQSSELFLTAVETGRNEFKIIAILVIIGGVLLVICFFSVLILPIIHSLIHSKMEVWSIFAEIPRYVVNLMRSKCIERVRLMPDTDFFVNVGESEYEEEGETGGNADRASGERERLMRSGKGMKGLVGKVAGFMVVTGVFVYLVYYVSFEVSGDAVRQEPYILDLASRRHHLIRSINHYLLESTLQNTTVGYKYLIPSNQLHSQPHLHAYQHISDLERLENQLIYGDKDSGRLFSDYRSREHNELLFENGCIAPVIRGDGECYAVGKRAMVQGLHSAVGVYVALAKTIWMKINAYKVGGNEGDMVLLRKLDERYLYDALQYSISLYERDYNASLDSISLYQNLLIALYLLFCLGYYLLVYRPMISQVLLTQLASSAHSSWSICLLLPLEFSEEFKQLIQLIRLRRDRFRWR